MKKILITLCFVLYMQLSFGQTNAKEEYCMVSLLFRFTGTKYIQELIHLKPNGETVVTPIEIDKANPTKGPSAYIVLINKLASEGWVAVNAVASTGQANSTDSVFMKRSF